MPDGFVTQCPACSAKLKLKEKPAQGKKLRCPKCSEVFAPSGGAAKKKAPKQDFDEYGPLDDSAGSLDPFDEPMQGRQLPGRMKPARVGGTKAPPRRKVDDESDDDDDAPASKPKKAGQGSNTAVLIIAGGLSFCLMFVVGYFAFAFVSRGHGLLAKMAGVSSGEGVPTKYLPNGPEVVICVRVADLAASSAGKQALADEEIKKPIEMFAETIGMQPKDIESVTLAIAASPAMRGPKGAAALSQLKGMSGEDTSSQTRCVVIVRSKKPFDSKTFGGPFKLAKLDTQPGAKTQFGGLRIFRRMETSMVAFPERNVMLLGSVLSVEEILANPSPSVPELDEVDPKQQVIVAVMPAYWPKEENLIRRRDDGPTGMLIRGMAGSLFARDLKLSSIGLTFGKDVRLHMTRICETAKAAEAQKKAIAADIAAGRHSGFDEDEEMEALAKGKGAKKPQPHYNPLSDPGLFDFSEAASDKANSLNWSEEAAAGTLDFTAVLKGEAPKAQVPQIVARLSFYQPNREGF